MVKQILCHFFANVKMSIKICFFAPQKRSLSVLNLLELVSYGKFSFSRQDLDGNKPAKCMCLARKARDREVYI